MLTFENRHRHFCTAFKLTLHLIFKDQFSFKLVNCRQHSIIKPGIAWLAARRSTGVTQDVNLRNSLHTDNKAHNTLQEQHQSLPKNDNISNFCLNFSVGVYENFFMQENIF